MSDADNSDQDKKKFVDLHPFTTEHLVHTYDENLNTFPVRFYDQEESLLVCARSDDESNESIVSSWVAQNAVYDGIRQFKKMTPIQLLMAPEAEKNANKFSFSRALTPQRTELDLYTGPMATRKICFLVLDAGLFAADALSSLIVLRHLKVCTRTLLQQSWR